jgi:hypothetical protein
VEPISYKEVQGRLIKQISRVVGKSVDGCVFDSAPASGYQSVGFVRGAGCQHSNRPGNHRLQPNLNVLETIHFVQTDVG